MSFWADDLLLTKMTVPTKRTYMKKSSGPLNQDESRSNALPYVNTAGVLARQQARETSDRTIEEIKEEFELGPCQEEGRERPPYLRQ